MGCFNHLRPHTVLSDHVKVGNFVEVKNSTVGEGSKLPHLQYIGDSDIGSGVNMGCGTITVNYDGKENTALPSRTTPLWAATATWWRRLPLVGEVMSRPDRPLRRMCRKTHLP